MTYQDYKSTKHISRRTASLGAGSAAATVAHNRDDHYEDHVTLEGSFWIVHEDRDHLMRELQLVIEKFAI